MRIDIPASLTAKYSSYGEDYKRIQGPGTVIVSFGNVEITRLPAIREVVCYYDTEIDRAEEDEVTQETLAQWLKEKLS